ncbi:MAG: hypothetical protein R3B93_00705 [Bacteroidia bacterium]
MPSLPSPFLWDWLVPCQLCDSEAAIKDPEELTYLFLTIGIGLAAGANQPIVAILAFVFITGLLYLNKKITGGLSFRKDDNMYLNVSTDKDDLTIISFS